MSNKVSQLLLNSKYKVYIYSIGDGVNRPILTDALGLNMNRPRSLQYCKALAERFANCSGINFLGEWHDNFPNNIDDCSVREGRILGRTKVFFINRMHDR